MSTPVQVMRVFPHASVTFSMQCEKCGRWVWCGREAHQAQCACGQHYEVLFDAEKPDWSKPQGWVCAGCGTSMRLLSAPSEHNPVRLMNSWQQLCAKCTPASCPPLKKA